MPLNYQNLSGGIMKHSLVCKYDRYRYLDLDDILILKLIGDGLTFSDTAKSLGLTPPAISHRLKKYEMIWEGFSIFIPKTKNQPRSFSSAFYKAHKIATQMLEAFHEEFIHLHPVSHDGDQLRIAG